MVWCQSPPSPFRLPVARKPLFRPVPVVSTQLYGLGRPPRPAVGWGSDFLASLGAWALGAVCAHFKARHTRVLPQSPEFVARSPQYTQSRTDLQFGAGLAYESRRAAAAVLRGGAGSAPPLVGASGGGRAFVGLRITVVLVQAPRGSHLPPLSLLHADGSRLCGWLQDRGRQSGGGTAVICNIQNTRT